MNKIKPILTWVAYLGLSIVLTPWILVVAIKLAFWPHLLNDCENTIVSEIKSEANESTALKTARDFLAVGVITFSLPFWLGIYLWIGLVVTYLFLLEIRLLTSSP